jgi:small subunit ribosomal protein S3
LVTDSAIAPTDNIVIGLLLDNQPLDNQRQPTTTEGWFGCPKVGYGSLKLSTRLTKATGLFRRCLATFVIKINIIMGQKVNPLGFRLGVSQKHTSHWFAKSQQYSQLVIEDHFLRESIHKKFPNAGIDSIHIEREVDRISIEIASARPRQLLGFFNREENSYVGIQKLRDQLTTQLSTYRLNTRAKNQSKKRMVFKESADTLLNDSAASLVRPGSVIDTPKSSSKVAEFISTEGPVYISIHLTKVSEPNASAACLSEFIVEELEKRVPFRRALKQAVQRAQRASVKGVKVQISGRLNGAEIARSERIHKGQVPLHTLRAKMQYHSRTAKTIYGLLGVKVWVFTGFC